MTQKEEDKNMPERSHQHQTEVRDFSNADTREQVLQELADAQSEYDVRRMAGTGIHAVMFGDLSFAQLTDMLEENQGCRCGCIDEHLTPIEAGNPGQTIITAHAECGAANGVHGAILSGNETVLKNVNAIFGEKLGSSIIEDVKNGTLAPDQLGQVWSLHVTEVLKQQGIDAAYQFVGVERYNNHGHDIHSATGVVVNMQPSENGNYLNDMDPQEKPFIVSHLGDLKITAREAALSSAIAMGGHGILSSQEGDYTVMVQGDIDAQEKVDFERQVLEYAAAFKADPSRIQFSYGNIR